MFWVSVVQLESALGLVEGVDLTTTLFIGINLLKRGVLSAKGGPNLLEDLDRGSNLLGNLDWGSISAVTSGRNFVRVIGSSVFQVF